MVQNPDVLPLQEAIKIVRPLKFSSKTSYQKWWSKKRPRNLAKDVWKVYALSRRKEWTGSNSGELWSYYLGTKIISNQEKNKNWLSYEEASKVCRKARITGEKDFFERSKNGTLPKGVPSRPYVVYKNKGWVSWGIFLGTGSLYNIARKFWPFKKARAYVRKIAIQYGIKNEKPDWRIFCRSGKLPKEIPQNPPRTYKKEWISWGDWLGTGTQSNKNKSQQFLPIKEAKIEARKIAKKLGIKTRSQWTIAYNQGKIPKNLPADIYRYNQNKKK